MPALQHTIGWNLIQKQPSCKKSVRPQEGHCEQRYETQGGNQEIAVDSKSFNNDNSGEFGAES